MPEQSEALSQHPDRGTEIVKTENGKEVSIKWREFKPEGNPDASPEKTVVYLPGWPTDARTKLVEDLPQSFADYSGEQSIAVSANSIDSGTSTTEENEAILKFLEGRGIKEMTLTAHSQGTTRAVDIANMLREREDTGLPQITVDGLVLISGVGYYPQNRVGLAAKFAWDGVISSALEINNQTPPAKAAPRDILTSVAGKFREGGIGYGKKFLKELAEMAKVSPGLADIDVPVVLIQPERDPVSDYKKIAPLDNPLPIKTSKVTESERAKMTPSELKERTNEVKQMRANRGDNARQRNAYLEENVFKKAPDVSIIIPEKHGRHGGMPVYRWDQAAKTSMYLLRRHQQPSRGK